METGTPRGSFHAPPVTAKMMLWFLTAKNTLPLLRNDPVLLLRPLSWTFLCVWGFLSKFPVSRLQQNPKNRLYVFWGMALILGLQSKRPNWYTSRSQQNKKLRRLSCTKQKPTFKKLAFNRKSSVELLVLDWSDEFRLALLAATRGATLLKPDIFSKNSLFSFSWPRYKIVQHTVQLEEYNPLDFIASCSYVIKVMSCNSLWNIRVSNVALLMIIKKKLKNLFVQLSGIPAGEMNVVIKFWTMNRRQWKYGVAHSNCLSNFYLDISRQIHFCYMCCPPVVKFVFFSWCFLSSKSLHVTASNQACATWTT